MLRAMSARGRDRIPWILVFGVVALSAIAGSVGVSQGRGAAEPVPTSALAFAPITGFGGYNSHGDVTQISAEWRVPTATNSTALGASATWIGAQGVGSTGPFIQLGSYSDEYQQASHSPATSYGLFWSDVPKGFHEVGIVRLEHAGDLIRFEMTKNPAGWRLAVENLSAGWNRSLEVHYGADKTFTSGEWIQEDPAAARITSSDVPYADTSIVSFQHLRVDEHVPHLNFNDALALSTVEGTYLVPTHVRNDAFSLNPAVGAARQFLADAEKLDSSLYAAQVALLSSRHPSARSLRASTAATAKAYGQFADQVEAQLWPVADRGLIRHLTADNVVLQEHLNQWTRSGGSTATLTQVLDDLQLRSDDKRLRASLGLPPAP
jgi:Peptidase A4 family